MDNEIRHYAFQGAIDPMWIIDIEGPGRYRFADTNDTFTAVTGWQKAQVIGQPMEKIVPESSHELVREKYHEAITTGQTVDYIEESVHPAGIKYGQIRVIPIKDAAGAVVKLLGIAHDITDKTLLQDALISERDRKNRQITAAAIKGQELERSRVSRELHDNVNQVLTTVKLYAELCLDGKVDHRQLLPKCIGLLSTAIDEIRSLSKQLSAPTLGDVNYIETFSDLVESVKLASGIAITLETSLSDCQEMDAELHLTIYRILQEQLTNIQKYAAATHVWVYLAIDPNELLLRIGDDGQGFDPLQKSRGIGLTNMRSRAQLLHGSFSICSEPGKGTEVEVIFPVQVADGLCRPAFMS
ncbi:PAS domain-containing sensor histidine kinase [Flaviaesturariibacter aridisoli]|uniref:Oxygen sensor histidine kinase NreB n=1 Tax=Flaviaesturariibacter aridisoli TaxID=2545761 RepID=A0A4R4E0W4_9BACT|nr:PAS domain-containing protein [Flaviaesturariibacter aridisoli]TCZ67904.1 PAS domain S-box protein [Flaviaesturariibacter aridisoli]